MRNSFAVGYAIGSRQMGGQSIASFFSVEVVIFLRDFFGDLGKSCNFAVEILWGFFVIQFFNLGTFLITKIFIFCVSLCNMTRFNKSSICVE